MLKTLKNAWRTPELRKRLLFTLLIIVIYRLGANIPVPYIDAEQLKSVSDNFGGTILQFLNMLSGEALGKATLFALGVSPYITSSIVMQLLSVAIPALERMSKEGPEGQKKITQITRYVTVVLALVTAFGYYRALESRNALTKLKELDVKGTKLPRGEKQAKFFNKEVVPAMEALRKPIDRLEMIVEKDMWPMPSYGDMIFEV